MLRNHSSRSNSEGGGGRTLPGIGEKKNFFIRIAFGHNEAQSGRVVHMSQRLTETSTIMFNEVFRVNFDEHETDPMPLYVELREQVLVESLEVGRFCMESDALDRQVRGKQPGDIAAEQVVRMMRMQSEKF